MIWLYSVVFCEVVEMNVHRYVFTAKGGTCFCVLVERCQFVIAIYFLNGHLYLDVSGTNLYHFSMEFGEIIPSL